MEDPRIEPVSLPVDDNQSTRTALVDRLSSTEVCTGSSLSSNGYRTPAKRSSGRRVTRFSWTLNLNGIIDIDQIEITIKDLHVFMNKSVNIDDSIGAGGRVCKKVCVFSRDSPGICSHGLRPSAHKLFRVFRLASNILCIIIC